MGFNNESMLRSATRKISTFDFEKMQQCQHDFNSRKEVHHTKEQCDQFLCVFLILHSNPLIILFILDTNKQAVWQTV